MTDFSAGLESGRQPDVVGESCSDSGSPPDVPSACQGGGSGGLAVVWSSHGCCPGDRTLTGLEEHTFVISSLESRTMGLTGPKPRCHQGQALLEAPGEIVSWPFAPPGGRLRPSAPARSLRLKAGSYRQTLSCLPTLVLSPPPPPSAYGTQGVPSGLLRDPGSPPPRRDRRGAAAFTPPASAPLPQAVQQIHGFPG